MIKYAWLVFVVTMHGVAAPARAEEWNQWRGNGRNGVAQSSPPLIEALPDEGLKPLWSTAQTLASEPAGWANGGWGSPVVADGRAYLFVHRKSQQVDKKPPAKQYPFLPEDKRGGMTPAEYEEYETKRREEDRMLSTFFDYRETIYCLDARTGALVWKNERPSVYSRFLQSCTPTVADGRLFVLGAGLMAHCVDAKTGKTLWIERLPGEFVDEHMASSFAVTDGVAVVLASQLMAVDVNTGSVVWSGDAKTARGVHSSPVLWTHAGQHYVVVNLAGSVTACFEPRTGRELWRVKSEAGVSTPVVVGNRLVTLGSSRRAGLRCFEMSLTEAQEVWVYQRVADKGSSPVVVGDYVFVQGERRLACVELASGREAWNAELDLATPQYTSLVAADGKVIYALDGVLGFAATAADYQPLLQGKINRQGLLASEATLRKLLKLDEVEREPGGLEKSTKVFQQEVDNQGPLACASPAIAEGLLYLRLRGGVVCYDLRRSAGADLR